MSKQVEKSRCHALDPRRALALQYYSDVNSETFSNASQSLRRAGFSDTYSLQSTNLKWLQAHRASFDVNLIKKAEKNLDRIASINIKLENKLGVEVAKLQADVSKFILDRLAKSKYGKTEEQKAPEITINIIEPRAPSATREAEVIEAEQIEP